MEQLITYSIIIASYLIGSFSSAIVTTKLMGLSDPRDGGSGNPGATNVLRTGGKMAAIITLVGDVLKGVIPVVVAQQMGLSTGVIAVCGIAAFMGHLYPIYYGFKGGKGVATAIGVFGALSMLLAGVYVLVWIIAAAAFRYSSLAGLIAAGVSGLASFAIFNEPQQLQLIGCVVWIVAFLFQRHRDNIERLKQGTESKIGAK